MGEKIMNDGKHIQGIIDKSSCKKHQAEEGEACWNIPSINGILRGICSRRARSVWTHEMGRPIKRNRNGFRGQKKEAKK